jgi:hypothetical protein
VKRVNLLGINNLDVSKLGASAASASFPFKLFSIPLNIDPYFSAHKDSIYAAGKNAAGAGMGEFDMDSLYGGDVIGKVMRFSDYTAALARTLDFDVIHAHDWMTMIAGMRIKHETGKPLVKPWLGLRA